MMKRFTIHITIILLTISGTLCWPEPLEIRLSKEITFSFDMLADDPKDPFFLGPPVFLSVSNPEVIQSATFWIVMEPIRVKSIEPVQENEFHIDFVQEGAIVKLSIVRRKPRTLEGKKLLRIKHNRFTHGNLGLHFGKFTFKKATVKNQNNQLVDFQVVNGTWRFVSDWLLFSRFRLVNQLTQKPLENFVIAVTGYENIPDLFEKPKSHLPTDRKGMTIVPFFADPSALIKEEKDGCFIPKLEAFDFWLQISPPPESEFFKTQLKITVPFKTMCDDDESIFEDVVLELAPKSQIKNYEIY